MVQVQSSWFPLVDRNPQTFVEITTAKPEDFVDVSFIRELDQNGYIDSLYKKR